MKHGLIYNIGNKKEISDLQLNYNLIVQKINEIKKLNQAFKYLNYKPKIKINAVNSKHIAAINWNASGL